MKLYNKTKYPDELLEALLVASGRLVGARTSNVIFVVTATKPGYNHTKGIAQQADWIKRFALEKRAYKKNSYELKKGDVATDGGWVRLTIPYPFIPKWIKECEIYPRWKAAHCFDGMDIAESIFSVACHEWQHIKQYQTGKYNFSNRTERRKHHDNRIWEKDAIKASNKATSKPNDKSQESIINMVLR